MLWAFDNIAVYEASSLLLRICTCSYGDCTEVPYIGTFLLWTFQDENTPLHPSCCTVPQYFSRYYTVRLKMLSLLLCVFCVYIICMKSFRNLLQNGHEFEQTPGGSERQRNLTCCSPWGHKESDTTE